MISSLTSVADALKKAELDIRSFITSSPSGPFPAPTLSGGAAGGSSSAADLKRKRKALKDPNAPKRPMTGYFLYANSVREAFAKANPDMPPKVLVGLMADHWNAMSDVEKKVSLKEELS